MPDNLEVKVEAQSDSFAARVLDVRVRSDARIHTPSRGVFLGSSPSSEARFVSASTGSGVVEIYRPLWQSVVDKIDSNNREQSDFINRVIPSRLREGLSARLVLAVFRLVEGRAEQPWLPTEQQTNYIADLLAAMPTAAVVPPALEGYSSDDLLTFLRRFLSRVRSNSKRKVIGLIPYLDSWREQERIQEFYLKEGVTSYVWDMHGHTPTGVAVNLRSLIAYLGQVDREYGPHFAHAMNVKYSQERAAKPMLPARDLLLLYEAFDSVGSSHIRPRLSEETRKKFLESPRAPTIRLLDSTSYGYQVLPLDTARASLTAAFAALGRTDAKDWLEDGADAVALKKTASLLSAETAAVEVAEIAKSIREKSDKKHLDGKAAVASELQFVVSARSTYSGSATRGRVASAGKSRADTTLEGLI